MGNLETPGNYLCSSEKYWNNDMALLGASCI